jgi:hypothetical protein
LHRITTFLPEQGLAAGVAREGEGEELTCPRSSAMAQSVSEFVWDRLHEWGVRRIFGYPGDGINGLIGALDK